MRREAIGIHLAFAHMHPLIRRTRHLSLNAIVASARLAENGRPFGIVANELSSVASELEKLIDEIERMFRLLVLGIARWGKTELHLAYVQRAQQTLQRTRAAPAAATPPTVGQEAAADAAADAGSLEDRTATKGAAALAALLLARIGGLRTTILTELDAIDLLAGKLSGRIDRINWVAVRQCHYTSISAQIEAAQVHNDTTGLASVALDIRALANDIAIAERQAKERAVRLRYMLKTRLPSLKLQVSHA